MKINATPDETGSDPCSKPASQPVESVDRRPVSDALRYLISTRDPAIVGWALERCLRNPSTAPDVVATLEPNEAARPTVLRALRELAKMKPEQRAQVLGNEKRP